MHAHLRVWQGTVRIARFVVHAAQLHGNVGRTLNKAVQRIQNTLAQRTGAVLPLFTLHAAMDPLKIIKLVMKPDQLKDKVMNMCTTDNAKTVVSMLAATTAMGLLGMGVHKAMSNPKTSTAPWLWVTHNHAELWQEYAKLRRTLRPKLRCVLDETVRRPMEWLMVMQASSPSHFHANTVATATRRVRTAENGLLTVVGASGVPWSVRTEASMSGGERRVAMPAHERPARAVNMLRTALAVMYRNIVQLCRTSMVSNALSNSYAQVSQRKQDSVPVHFPGDVRRGRIMPWHTAHDASTAAQDGVEQAQRAQTREEYVKATAHARIMRRLQEARAARV